MPYSIVATWMLLLGNELEAVGNSSWLPAATEVVISADGAFCDPHSQIFLF